MDILIILIGLFVCIRAMYKDWLKLDNEDYSLNAFLKEFITGVASDRLSEEEDD